MRCSKADSALAYFCRGIEQTHHGSQHGDVDLEFGAQGLGHVIEQGALDLQMFLFAEAAGLIEHRHGAQQASGQHQKRQQVERPPPMPETAELLDQDPGIYPHGGIPDNNQTLAMAPSARSAAVGGT